MTTKKKAGAKLKPNDQYINIAICDAMNIMNLDGMIMVNNLVASDYLAARMFCSMDNSVGESYLILYALTHYLFDITDYASLPEYNALDSKYTQLFKNAKQRSVRLFEDDRTYGYAATFVGKSIGLDMSNDFTGTSVITKFNQKFQTSIEILPILYFIDDPEDIRSFDNEDLKGDIIFIKVKKCKKYSAEKKQLPTPKVLKTEIGYIYKRTALSQEAKETIINDKSEMDYILFLNDEEKYKITH